MIVLIGSEKGGSGKTTVATNLAAQRAADGKEVLLVDSDPQHSATDWAAVRQDSERGFPQITCISKMGKATGLDIVKMRDKFDDIIVDAGGRDSVELRTVMIIADKMIVPLKPGQFDVWGLTTIETLVYDAKARGNETLRPLICLNLVNPNPVMREAEDVIDYAKEFDVFEVAESRIHDRIAFRNAAREGCGVFELARGDNKAITELNYLYERIFQ